MNKEEKKFIKQEIKKIKHKYPDMGVGEMWYWNFDYYQIPFRKFEKIYNKVIKKNLDKNGKK